MLYSLPIIGASATALTLYLTLHLLAVGAFSMPAHMRADTRVPVAISREYSQGAAEGTVQAVSAAPRAFVAPAGQLAFDSLQAAPAAARYVPSTRIALAGGSLLTLLAPRAP